MDSFGAHDDPVHPLSFNLANRQTKVKSDRGSTAIIPDYHVQNVVMRKHVTVAIHMRNDALLQDFVSISDAHQCTSYMHKLFVRFMPTP